MRTSTLALGLVLLAACSKTPATQPTTTPDPTGDPTGEPTPANTGGDRPQITAAACEEQGGKVVGDIGDGAIHRPEYVCPDSGTPPIGTITADPGAPQAIEGSVCCK